MNYQLLTQGWKSLFTPTQERRRARSYQRAHSKSLRVESLESRTLLAADPIPVQFNIPADVQSMGVWVEVSAQLINAYETKAGPTIDAGTWVYYDSVANDYAKVSDVSAAAPLIFKLSGSGAIVELPNTYARSGQIVMGVADAPYIPIKGGIPVTPVSGNNPDNYFSMFEYTIDGGGVDIDMTEVDQIGFPYVVTTLPEAPIPANVGIGIDQHRGDMFNLFGEYIAEQGETAAPYMGSFTAGDGYRLLGPQHLMDPNLQAVQSAPGLASGGHLVAGQTYYYWVTATNAHGETIVSNFQPLEPPVQSIRGVKLNVGAAALLSWSAVEGATGYNIYRSQVAPPKGQLPDPALAQLIGSTSVATSQHPTTFTDNTPLSQQGKAPPTNGYTYNPFNAYFNDAINEFFAHYEAPNSFTILNQGTGQVYTGQTNNNYVYKDHTYTVLQLTTPSITGTFQIYKPFFQENTNIEGAPPAPDWLGTSKSEPPAKMVLSTDAVFNSGSLDPEAPDAGRLSDLENMISSAFNRGIANNFDIKPNNWANHPQLTTIEKSADGASSLPAGTYYYVMTTVNEDGESTPSIERKITTDSGEKVTLTWVPETAPTGYRIYRSETPGTGYQLLTEVTNPVSPNATQFEDNGSDVPSDVAPPYWYYAANSTANFYAGFLHQNVTTNPGKGISISGLAYGYPYDDDGGNSTNIQSDFTHIYIDIMPWGRDPNPPHPGPSGPATLQILHQPTNGAVGSVETVTFQVLSSQGLPYLGGTTVSVELVGAESGSYSVETNHSTGIGSLQFTNQAVGTSMLQFELEDGSNFDSNHFLVYATPTPGPGPSPDPTPSPPAPYPRCIKAERHGIRSMAVDMVMQRFMH